MKLGKCSLGNEAGKLSMGMRLGDGRREWNLGM